MNASTTSSLIQIGATVGTIGIGAVSALFAKSAADRSKPTSNGFVAGLNERLDRQDAMLERLDSKLDRTDARMTGHLAEHWRRSDDGK